MLPFPTKTQVDVSKRVIVFNDDGAPCNCSSEPDFTVYYFFLVYVGEYLIPVAESVKNVFEFLLNKIFGSTHLGFRPQKLWSHFLA